MRRTMHSSHRSLRRGVAVALLILLALSSTACGTSDPGEAKANAGDSSKDTAEFSEAPFAPLPEEDSEIAAQFPDDVKELRIAVNVQVPPAVYKNGDSEIVGYEADLMRMVGALSGRDIKFSAIEFSALIPGLQSGRYDIGVATIGIHPERTKILDMIQDSATGTVIATRAGEDADYAGLKDLCGVKVATLAGSVYVKQLAEASQTCVEGGDPEIDTNIFPQQADANLALRNRRVDVVIMDQLAASFATLQNEGDMEVQATYRVNPNGISLLKGSELTEPVQVALQKLIDDGAYADLMDYWGASDASVAEAKQGK